MSEFQNSEKEIKMIALDLDGTTLTKRGLTARTKRALENAIANGVHVVIATGRTFTALPKDIFSIKGLQYVVTSNGAQITDLKKETVIYSNCIAKDRIHFVSKLLEERGFPIEVFTEGKAYVDETVYQELKQHGSNFMNAEYVLRTRIPVSRIYDFMLSHDNVIENINIHFEFLKEKIEMKQVLEQLEGITVTSSFPHNLEIGGATTSKATGLAALCDRLALSMEQVMACGDSPNDIAMIRAAGLGIAMGNGEEEVKRAADYIGPGNEEEGVAYVVEKFVLKSCPEKTVALHHAKNTALNITYSAAKGCYKRLIRRPKQIRNKE